MLTCSEFDRMVAEEYYKERLRKAEAQYRVGEIEQPEVRLCVLRPLARALWILGLQIARLGEKLEKVHLSQNAA